MSLQPRSGPLGIRLASHLLRRASFSYSIPRIQQFATMSASDAVDQLFQIPNFTHPEGPINWEDGQTAWLTDIANYRNGPATNMGPRRNAIWLWVANESIKDTSIRHKMAFFWHAIFVTEIDNDWREFNLFRLFQEFCIGNIRDLAYKTTLDSKMLRYLNNNTNDKGKPNENYAREFLELFTILKGATIGTGNYTNYTEEDIIQAARVLTGFNDSNNTNLDPDTGLTTGIVNYNQHDAGNKTFSAAFGHQTIQGATDAEDMYRELGAFVDMIFHQMETARAYVRRLYRFFVSDKIVDTVEQQIIEPLSIQLYNDQYEIEGTLKALLKSDHFYDSADQLLGDQTIGAKIKSPLELLLGSLNLFDANQMGSLSADPAKYINYPRPFLLETLLPLGFSVYPLSVEGYPGFFKSPNYSKYWFDQATIAYRYRLPNALIDGKAVKGNRNAPFQMDVVSYFDQHFMNQEYAEDLVRQFLEFTLPAMPDGERFGYFLQKLLGDLSTINWMFEWQNFKQSGEDDAVRIALTDLFEAVVGSPEFQTF